MRKAGQKESQTQTGPTRIDRRDFFKLLGGGVVVYFSGGIAGAQGTKKEGGPKRPAGDFNAYVKIGGNGRITCYTGKVELGQGIITSLAQTAAEELDVPLDSVDMVMADTGLCPYDAGTFGSLTTPYFGPVLKEAAAEVRSILLQLAARRLKRPVDQLQAKDGIISDRKNIEIRVSYGELVRDLNIQKELKTKPL